KSTRLNSSHRRRHTRYIGDWRSDVCSSSVIGSKPGRSDPLVRCRRDKGEGKFGRAGTEAREPRVRSPALCKRVGRKLDLPRGGGGHEIVEERERVSRSL